MYPFRIFRSSGLSIDQDKLHATVLRLALDRIVGCTRAERPDTDSSEPVRRDAILLQGVHHGLGASFRELEIVIEVAGIVGVTDDSQFIRTTHQLGQVLGPHACKVGADAILAFAYGGGGLYTRGVALRWLDPTTPGPVAPPPVSAAPPATPAAN